jgi:glutamate racemase
MAKKGSIGVFDSGLGGLWVLKHLKEELPEYNYIFLADQKNMPYGERTPDELFILTIKALDYLYGEKNCAGVILACNTVSSTIYDKLREWKDEKYFGRIIFGIVRPTVESINNENQVVVFSTPRTCLSEVYENFLSSNIKSYIKLPMNNLASIIEEKGDVYSYISLFKDKVPNNITRGALLCTHYGIVREDFKKVFPSIKEWIYQEEIIPKYMKDYFIKFPEREAFFSHDGHTSIFVTKENKVFENYTKEWFGESVGIELVNLDK